MTKQLYPTFDINSLAANKLSDEMLNVDHFSLYLSQNPHLKVLHKHSFFHLVYFTEGSGHHIIDFESFPVQRGMIYFMHPGQVHQWNFEGEVDGFIINFSPQFFSRYLTSGDVTGRFSFFGGDVSGQVIVLDEIQQSDVEALFKWILQEKERAERQYPLMIASLLIRLFVTVQRSIPEAVHSVARPNHNVVVFRNFQALIEQHFLELKLPKDYAALLHITPGQLNAVCKEQSDTSAGELIRRRIILEAKRLLINLELSVSHIALELNFPDASYFVKFFKKYVGLTPDAFRKSQLGQ